MTSPEHAEVDCACNVSDCRAGCGIEVVDGLLSTQAFGRGPAIDLLLDLRGALARNADAERVLDLFFTLKRTMEQKRPVSFYRLRRWLENHLIAVVRVNGDVEDRITRVTLNRKCLEAVRCSCILAARRPGEPLRDTSIRIVFMESAKAARFTRNGPFVVRT